MYCVRLDLAARLLPRIGNANKSGEYYITDLISLAVAEGCKVHGRSPSSPASRRLPGSTT